jgi:eukaryotic-like serine/threonine-protein kinase
MNLNAGARIGSYDIISPLGAGGMGEVYRARDSKLNRDVAIKILPEALAADPVALARFEREAQAVAALSHPNILAIHDFGREGETAYAVMELLEGETLRARLAHGALPSRKAVDLAVQIAEGLAAAHEKGIVHRDLKPENVFVTHDGRAKVLDFGLAKRTDSASNPSVSTLATGGHTGPGLVLGTPAYMSPEQVRGEAVDHRSDIFSFGALLYEMLTGRQAFARETATESMTAILKEDPSDITTANSGVSPALQRIAQHCLEKKPGERFQSARDIAFALRALSGSASGSASAPMEARPRRSVVRPLIGPLVGALAGAFLALVAVRLVLGWHADRAAAPPAPPSFRRLTFGRGAIDGARFVPGSRDIAYSARWQGNPSTVYLLREGSVEPRALETPGAMLLATSAQGSAAVMTSPALNNGMVEGPVSVMPLAGGGPREISRIALSADFTDDGAESCLVTRSGGNGFQLEWPLGEVLLKPSSDPLRSPRLRGGQLAFFEASAAVVADGDIRVVSKGGKPRTLLHCTGFTSLAWGPDGHEIWFSTSDGGQSEIRAVTLEGQVRLVARYPGRLDLVDVDAAGRGLAVVSSQVRQAYGRAPHGDRDIDLTWLDAQTPVALRADGSQVLLAHSGDWEMGRHVGLYLRPLGPGPATNLGTGSLDADISPDGRWVAVLDTDAKGQAGVRLIPTGAGIPRWYPLTGAAANTDGLWFHPAGRAIYLAEEVSNSLSRLDLETGTVTPKVVPGPVGYNMGLKGISPNGRRTLLTNMNRASLDERAFIFLVFDGEGAQPTPTKGNLRTEVAARWADDNREVYLYDRNAIPAKVVRWDPLTGARRPFLEIMPSDPSGVWGISNLTITPSGHAYAYSVARKFSDLYLIEGLK